MNKIKVSINEQLWIDETTGDIELSKWRGNINTIPGMPSTHWIEVEVTPEELIDYINCGTAIRINY